MIASRAAYEWEPALPHFPMPSPLTPLPSDGSGEPLDRLALKLYYLPGIYYELRQNRHHRRERTVSP